MLSNFVVGQQKFVLFVDDVGIERHSKKILQNLLRQQGQNSIFTIPDSLQIDFSHQCNEIPNDITSLPKTANILLKPLSELLLTYHPRAVFHLIDRLKRDSNTKQIFLWATTRNISENFVVPFIEYMADTIVTLKDSKHLAIITRKSGGSVTNKLYQYQISDENFAVKELKKAIQKQSEPIPNPENLGTFKINLEEEELVARNALKLPYERTSDAPKEGEILYVPDANDDFDEEDPDDDLYI